MRKTVVILGLLGLLAGLTLAQSSESAAPGPSRADLAAAQQASFSAEKIIPILMRNPVLLLDVKRVLIKTAYEQGRLLDPDDLTDVALYKLIKTDENVRVIATQKILEAQQRALRARAMQAQAGNKSLAAGQPESGGSGETGTATTPPMQKAAAPNPFEGGESDIGMPPITPEQLPLLLAGTAAQSGSRVSLAGDSGDGAGGLDSTGEGSYGGGDSMTAMRAKLAGNSGTAAGADPLTAMLGPGLDMSSLAGSPDLAVAGGAQKQAGKPSPAPPSLPVKPTPPKQAARPEMSHQPDPYANVPSLYDLYEQVNGKPVTLERFGSDIFRNGTGNFENLPMDLPVGPDYILGPGDGVKIDLWGSVSQRLQRVVNREGRMDLPEVGSVMVAGRTLGQVQHDVQTVLRTQFRDVQSDVSISRIRSVRVYVVGEVSKPGAYDVSSLSTPLNAVYAAGGPTPDGSLRTLRHYRGKQLIQEVDVYDLLLHGVNSDIMPLNSGDTILVPAIGPQVTVEGMVRRPAIYELGGETSLAGALELAGGVLPTGTFRHIDVERLQAHEGHTALRLDIPDTNDVAAVNKVLADFKVQDGDKVRIAPILPYNNQTVYLDGHVFHPGKYPYRPGMKVTDLIKSYSDLLPEPSRRHAEVIRLQPPDFTPEVIAFNLADALDGKGDQDMTLKAFDTVRVFGRYTFEDPPLITVNGEVRDPGDHRTNGETHLRDAVYLAGGLTPNAQVEDAQVFRKTSDGGLKVIDVDLKKALNGDPANNVLLQPLDRVFIHRNLERTDPAGVYIKGEVANPGKYPLGSGMTASELVRLAGGFKRSAYLETADLSRYPVQNGKRVVGDHQEVAIAKAMSGDPAADVSLYPGDVLTIRELAGWHDIGAAVTVKGEVLHPGTYGIREGERLSSVIRRAGGFRSFAYPQGAVFEREQVREIAEKNREELIARIQSGEGIDISKGTMLAAATGGQSEQAQIVKTLLRQREEALTTLRGNSASGRMVIHITPDIAAWANTPADVEVRAGDTLLVPKKPNFVLVTGQVYNATAIAYTPGRNAGWYLNQAGGTNSTANKKAIYVIRANGGVVARGSTTSNWWRGNVLNTPMQPGDTLVVPEKITGGSAQFKTLLTTAESLGSLAIAARVATSF